MTLRSRLTLFFVGIVILPLVAATVAFQAVAARQADARTDTRLDGAARAVRALWQERLLRVRDEVSLVAERLAPTIEEPRLPTRVEEGRAGTELDFVVVSRLSGPLAISMAPAEFEAGVEAPTPESLVAGPEWPLLIRARIEIVSGSERAVVTGGRYADSELARELASAASVDVAVVEGDRVIASSGPVADASAARRGDEGMRTAVVTFGEGQSLLLATTTDRGASGWTWVIAIAGLVAAAVLGFALASVVARPLERLAEGARKVAAGDLDTRVEAGERGDVARVADAFNTMTDYLRTYVGELQSSRDELRRSLDRLGATLRTTLDLEGMLEVVLDTAAVTLGARAGALFLLRAGDRNLHLEVARGYEPPREALLAVGQGIAGRAAAQGAPVLLRQEDGMPVAPVEPSASTAVAVPLVRGDRTIGVIALYGRATPDPFDQEDAETLSSFAGQASVAIENVLLHQETRQLSITDGLTGVWNRRYLEMTLRKEVERAQRFGRPLSVLLLDIDRFKRVNDRYGHQRGDEVLVELTRRIIGEIRSNIDIVSRYGGEEFVIVLPETPSEGARIVAEKIREAVREQPFATHGNGIGVTVSVGVATYPEDGTSAEDVLRAADGAMYRAKAGGRDRVEATPG